MVQTNDYALDDLPRRQQRTQIKRSGYWRTFTANGTERLRNRPPSRRFIAQIQQLYVIEDERWVPSDSERVIARKRRQLCEVSP
jgi:hypothetical protein